MLTILSAVFVFGVLVTVHELGHFLAAKAMGMRVEEFAIGFGPGLFQTKDGDTTYSLRMIPLGGYNKIAGMDPDDPVEENSFKSKSIPARMLVILAGALMNFVLPIILFTGIFLLEGINKPVSEPVIGNVTQGMAAEKVGLRAGDKIITINGSKIGTWEQVLVTLRANGTDAVRIVAERGTETEEYVLHPEFNKEHNRALVGISPKITHYKPGFFEAVKLGVVYTGTVISSMVDGLIGLVSGRNAADISGPIGVAQMAGRIAEQGVLPLFNFVAFLSINLGVINLLPLPALDGGHFILLLVEALRGKSLGSRAMNNIQMIGVVLILALTVFSTFKDITR